MKLNTSAYQLICKELRIRTLWVILCIICTSACCYTFSEELLFLLAKPFILASKANSFFLSTQLTETLNTYVTSALILGVCTCTPYFIYQIWCFCIPSLNQSQRLILNRFGLFSAFAFLSMLSFTFMWILPNIWSMLYKLNHTTTNLFLIQLQPKIYDFLILTLRFVLFSSICSQIPLLICCFIEYNAISIDVVVDYRRYFAFCSVLITALLTPPDLWCQFTAFLLMYVVIECTILYGFVRAHYAAKRRTKTCRKVRRGERSELCR